MFKKIKQFLRNMYLGVVALLIKCFMSLTFSMMYRFLAFKRNDRVYVESLATRFAVMTADMIRQVIVLKGKDPDYVAPPPVPVEKPTTKSLLFKGVPYHLGGCVGNFEDHPVIRSRRELEARAAVKKAGIAALAAEEAAKNAPQVVAPTTLESEVLEENECDIIDVLSNETIQ